MLPVVIPLVTFAAAVLLTGCLVPVLHRVQLMDVPNARSSHARPVPRGGGLAVMAAVVFGVAMTALIDVDRVDRAVLVVVGVALALAAVGFADDRSSLSSRSRLAAQIVAAVAVVALSATLGTAGVPGLVFWAVSLVAVVGYVNAYNFMDGINGISSFTGAVAGLWWLWQGGVHDVAQAQVLGAVVLGAMLGFAPWNVPVARIFLGDVGSYGIGLLIVATSVLGWAGGAPALVAVAPLVVYGADTGWVLIKRARDGRRIGEAHREHVYQRLVDGGWSHPASALLCAGASAAVCLSVALAPWPVAVALSAGCVMAYLCVPRIAGREVSV